MASAHVILRAVSLHSAGRVGTHAPTMLPLHAYVAFHHATATAVHEAPHLRPLPLPNVHT